MDRCWWHPAVSSGERQAPATNILACPNEASHPLATEQMAQVCPLGKARMQHAELGAAVPVGVAGKEGTSGLAPAWQQWGQCLCQTMAESSQDCETCG